MTDRTTGEQPSDVEDQRLTSAFEGGRTSERATIVAWLRKQRPEGSGAWDYAAAIERREHDK